RRRQETSCAAERPDETRRPAIQRAHDDAARNAARVDEFAAADVDPHMRDFVVAAERQQIAWLESAAFDRLADQRLLIRSPWQRKLHPREHETHETAAIEAVPGRASPQDVGLSDHGPRDRDYRVALRRAKKLESRGTRLARRDSRARDRGRQQWMRRAQSEH